MTHQTPYVTLEEAAEHFRVSLSTFRGWVRKGTVPKETYLQLGSVYRFNLPAVEDALMAQTTHKGDDK
jgi:excisionase family DNA binding protein